MSSSNAPAIDFGLESAIRGATRGGRVVMLGLLPTGLAAGAALAGHHAGARTRRFLPVQRRNRSVLAALADGSLIVEPVISHEFGIEDGLEAFAVAKDASTSAKVLLAF